MASSYEPAPQRLGTNLERCINRLKSFNQYLIG